MRRVLPENVELTLKVLRVKRAAAGRRSISVVRTEDDKRLEDGGLLASRGRAEDSAIRGDFSPAEDAQAEVPVYLPHLVGEAFWVVAFGVIEPDEFLGT